MDWTIHLSDVVTLFPPLTETNKTHYPSSTQEPSNCAQWHLDACGIGPSRLEITPWVGNESSKRGSVFTTPNAAWIFGRNAEITKKLTRIKH